MSSPLSALRRPRPLSLPGSRASLMKRMSHPMEGSVMVRWASIAPYLIEESGPPPPPLSFDQIQHRQPKRQEQPLDQKQLENGQRARQQKEMQRVLAKDRLLLREQVQHQQQQRAHEYMAHSRQEREIHQRHEKQQLTTQGNDSLAQVVKAHRRLASSGDIVLRATSGTRVLGHKRSLSTNTMATFLPPSFTSEAISEEITEHSSQEPTSETEHDPTASS
ncbi:hypothetical protein BGZ92_007407 [Podila epicladia]|nr:hypothetical protein BGZ92_007407 [Podila epicladia]